ncbi:MAG: ATP-binding protein [Gillisia sp.]
MIENPFILLERCRSIFNSELKDKVFDVFARLAGKEYSGNGVGLSIAKKIVEKHHGNIWLETEEGKGSVFFFTLPDDENKN